MVTFEETFAAMGAAIDKLAVDIARVVNGITKQMLLAMAPYRRTMSAKAKAGRKRKPHIKRRAK